MRACMLTNFFLALVLLFNTSSMAASADEAAVAQALDAFRAAVIAKDKGQFEKLLADQLIYGHSDGRTDTKASFITDAMSKRALWKVIDYQNQTIAVTGDIAVVRHIFTGESEREGGKMQSTKVGAMTIWQKQGGNWRLLARQAYRL